MTFAPEELSLDGFLDGRIHLWQPKQGYRAAIDPVLLAAFVAAAPGERVLELGIGAGAATLCLAARVGGLILHGLEIQPAYADLARRNAAVNAVPLDVHEGDLRRPPAALRALSFDHVLANPPFHAATAPAAADPGRDRANRAAETTPADWVDAGLRRLRTGGYLSLIHHPDRLGQLLATLEGRASSLDIVPVTPRAGCTATRVLIRARKGKGGGTRIWQALSLHSDDALDGGDGGFSEAAESVLREGRDLLPASR